MNKKAIIHIEDWGEKCLVQDTVKDITITLIDDTLVVKEEYMISGIKTKIIALDTVNVEKIDSLIANIKTSNENTHRNACDGEGVKVVLYENNEIVRETDLGYIYGTNTLEPFVDYVRSLIK